MLQVFRNEMVAGFMYTSVHIYTSTHVCGTSPGRPVRTVVELLL